MNNDEIADVLADTREYLEKNGWITHTMGQRGGPACTLGAMIYSQEWNVLTRTEPMLVAEALLTALELKAVRSNALPGLTDWNDHAESKQTVLDGLAKAEKVIRTGYDPDR